MPKFGPTSVVCVEWDDAMMKSGWSGDEDYVRSGLARTRQFNVGWLMKPDKKYVYVCSGLSGSANNDQFEVDSCSEVFKIPKGCIVKIHNIKDFSTKYEDGTSRKRNK